MELKKDRIDRLSEEWALRAANLDIRPWQVWGRITRINDIFLLKLNKILSQNDLSYSELQTLGALIVSGPPYELNPNTISRHNLLTSGGMTNVLTRMEKKGLITRRKDARDRRGVIVSVTERGLDIFETVIVAENAIEHRLIKGLSETERTVIAVVLRKLLLSIDEED